MSDTLSSRLKVLRKARGLSQEQLAVTAGISTSTVVRIENGRIVPDTKTIEKLAVELGVTAAELLGGEPAPARREPYRSLQSFLSVHGQTLPVADGERAWLLSQQFPDDVDIGDRDWWMAQLMLYRNQRSAKVPR